MKTVFYLFVFGVCISAQDLPFGSSKLPENVNITTKIVGGTVAFRGEFPWIIQISHSGQPVCGGSIVNQNWIVTAAHCSILEISGYTVTAGEYDLRFREGSEQTRTITRMVNHPQYNVGVPYANDIAVWRVNIPFTFNIYVQPVLLAGPLNVLDNMSAFFVKQVVVAGWGHLSYGGNPSPVLRKVSLPIVPTATCRSKFTGVQEIVSGMICAGVNGRDACQGDSGGPLVRLRTLVGVVSVGIGCNSGYPGIYSDIGYYSRWIFLQVIN